MFSTLAVLACIWMFTLGTRISRRAPPFVLIVNNLRLLESAKDQWAHEYGLGAEPVATWPVLIPYLKGGTIHPVTNEIYSLNTVGFAATARLSVPLGTYAAGSFITVP